MTKISLTRTARFCAVRIDFHQFFEIFENFDIFEKYCRRHNPRYRIFPDLSLAPCQSTCIHLVGNQFSSKSHHWIASYDHICTLAIPKIILTSTARLTPTARIILLSESDSRLYQPCRMHQSHARPPKFTEVFDFLNELVHDDENLVHTNCSILRRAHRFSSIFQYFLLKNVIFSNTLNHA